ncbi:acyltransferase family protein [Pseudanabaena mucicola]|uniref:Acyltransferase n=1 Tax=Pseudanabaena mucicola FACHB-723 TaxID=2692860 RepID=A0ABR7ZVR1_9CYAN|nr:acyltransferase [Pseudanabaena mucicola]MBD2187897.1 acyltransferase [Pseudanabaena mucicola FACHB-723]
MRNNRVDILRFLGLAMIVLAHVNPPGIIFQIRNFDVPLMVMISAVSFSLSYKQESYTSYLSKRVKRLLFPLWVFLTCYFALVFFTGYPIKLPSVRTILESYFLLSGIGFVWIIRVFLFMAALAPFIMNLHLKFKKNFHYFLIIGLVYLAYEIILLISKPFFLASKWMIMFENIVLYLMPYAVIFAIGLRLNSINKKLLVYIAILALSTFGIMGLSFYLNSGLFIQTQAFKYPPSIYYLSYALGISIVLWLVSGSIMIFINKLKLTIPVLFIAQNSMWIYLWHIPLLNVIKLPFYFNYFLIFLTASLITFIQVRLIRYLVLPNVRSINIRKNINMIFTG